MHVYRSFGEYRGNGFREPLEPIHNGDQDVLDAPGFEFVHHPQPELCPFGLLNPQAQDLLGAIRQNAERHINGLVANKPLVPDLEADSVKKHQGITGIQGPILPFGHGVHHGVRHPGNQVRGDINPIKLLQMAPDLPHRKPTGIHGYDLLIKIRKPALLLGDQLGIKGTRPVPGNIQNHLRGPGYNGLTRTPITPVLTPRRLFVLKVNVQLGIENPLR
jgi:hypothetical protein